MANTKDPTKDIYKNKNPGLSGPGRKTVAITKSDTDQTTFFRKIYCGSSGNVVVIGVDNDDSEAVTFAVVAGQWLDQLYVRRVTNATTATGLIGVP